MDNTSEISNNSPRFVKYFTGKGKKRTILLIFLLIVVAIMLVLIQREANGNLYKGDLVYSGVNPLRSSSNYQIITPEISEQILTRMRKEYVASRVFAIADFDKIPNYLVNPVKDANPSIADNNELLLPLVNEYLKEREIVTIYNTQLKASISPVVPIAK